MFGILDIAKMGAAAIAAFALAYVTIGPLRYHQGLADGRAAVVAEVTKRNEQAGAEAGKAKSRIDACYDRGGAWDQESGSCVE